MIVIVELELLGKLQKAFGSMFLTYYLEEVKAVPKQYLPALMVFCTQTDVIAKDTLKDQHKHSITIRVVDNVMSYVDEKGIKQGHLMPFTSPIGVFRPGETVTGGTSHATTTVIESPNTNDYILSDVWVRTFQSAETITGSTSGATAHLGSSSQFGMLQAPLNLRQLVEGRDPVTKLLLPNSVLGVLRNKVNLRGVYYYFSNDIKIQYKTITHGQFFYVAADIILSATTDLIQRPGY